MTAQQLVRKANGSGMVVIGGVGATSVKEVLDWLWDVGLQDSYPMLYDLLHLQGVDAGIMAMIAGFFVWIGRRRR